MSEPLWSAAEDAWLSDCFGGRVLRVVPADGSGRTIGACLSERPCRFAYAKLPAGASAAADALRRSGFAYRETEVRLRRPAGSADGGGTLPRKVRAAVPSDAESVETLAEGAFVMSRYFTDAGIPDGVARRIKREWAGNYFKGTRGQAMWVAEDEGRVAGFSLLLRNGDGWAIDLIAVAEPQRGRGWARALIDASAGTADGTDLRVGTQLTNAPSLRLYLSMGFVFDDAHGVWHYHAPAVEKNVRTKKESS